jgi:hypothetical protein
VINVLSTPLLEGLIDGYMVGFLTLQLRHSEGITPCLPNALVLKLFRTTQYVAY